ncbi:succinate-semialdehyde dehydrogenase [Candidatus Gracilibacteria bacterium]|nr:MAG: succinate-semialdehyde dehydrogenase [Candidatus Gracilibacteria bacterium]PIE85315.1 MAG: succinate-semialdehyde dehydrogenase [Candidatus Gracilibacteria bacterium]
MSTLQSINPYTGEINAEFETLNLDEVNKKIKTAHTAYLSWKETSNSYKKELFLKLADVLEADIKECARLETIEMGMLNIASKTGLQKTVGLIRWFANNFEEILHGEKEYETEGLKVKEYYDPIGVIFGIAPWNSPFNQLLRAAVPNILAGNTQIYKHSSSVPMTAIKIQELFNKAGFPEGVYTNLFINPRLSEDIISNKLVAGVNLTGSEGAGSSVGALAGKYLKPCVLELGGNDAFLVLQDSDLEKITDLAVTGRIRNGGQACNSSKRFLVPEDKYDEFLNIYKQKMEALKIGDPMNENTQIQPLSTKKAVLEIEKQVQKAIDSGAKLITGGKAIDLEKCLFPATILANVTKQVTSFNEEIFGPVASVMKYKTIEEAIELANATDFGLSATVHGNNLEEAKKVASKLEGGMIFINNIAGSRASLPFGGVKKSGYGKENGPDGLKAFTNKKVVII